jgi:hypothetical protein
MDNRPDIWRRLQDHETTPPQELSGRVLHAFRATHALGADQPHPDQAATNPLPAHPSLHTSTENGLRSLERLQQYITPPPAFMQAAIRNSTIGSGPRRNGWSPPFRFFYGAVAACLAIVAGLVFYLAEVSPQKQTKDLARKTKTPASVLPAQQDTTAPQSMAGDSSGVATAVTGDATDSTTAGSTAGNITIKANRPKALYIDHRSFPLVDNDLLVTFTSFRYPEIADHVGKADDKDMRVHLDQYTNIVISKQVVTMIKEMYQTRSNGKPTRRARKMKDRLEDWKKADEKHFDSTAFFNAADPIDLAGFIFK